MATLIRPPAAATPARALKKERWSMEAKLSADSVEPDDADGADQAESGVTSPSADDSGSPTFCRGEKVLHACAASFGPPLGDGTIGVVYAGRLHGRSVALKCASIRGSQADVLLLKHEGAMYAKLQELQGDVLPAVVECCQIGKSYCLATTIVRGEHPSPWNLASAEQREQAVKSLVAVHARGVLHGSMHHKNVILEKGSGKVRFIDLGRSCCNPTPAECQAEVRQLHAVLSGSTKRASSVAASPRAAPPDGPLAPAGNRVTLFKLGYPVVDNAEVAQGEPLCGRWPRAGSVYGVEVALKFWKCEEGNAGLWTLKHEAEMYATLWDLQGGVLPRVVEFGRIDGQFCLATTLVKGAHPAPGNWATLKQRKQAEETLRMLHARGVAHGSVRRSHLILEEGSDKVVFLDLGSSYQRPTAAECEEELQELDNVLSGGASK